MSAEVLRDLAKDIRKTAKIRFNAAARLEYQHTLSQWTVALSSTALILIPLIVVFQLPSHFSEPEVAAAQVALAVVVLVSSLLLGHENYSLRAAKQHQCGLALLTLAHEARAEALLATVEVERLKHFLTQYEHILAAAENHDEQDRLIFRLDNEELTTEQRIRTYLKFRWYRTLSIAHFLLLLAISVGALGYFAVSVLNAS